MNRTKQLKVIKVFGGDKRIEHPNMIEGWALHVFKSWSPAPTPPQAGNSKPGLLGEAVDPEDLQNFQNEKEATALNCP